jgi:hypothetical protein
MLFLICQVYQKLWSHILYYSSTYESGDKNNPLDTSLRMFNARYITKSVKVSTTQKAAMRTNVPSGTHTAAPIPNERLIPIHLILKKQIHLTIEVEVVYPGTKSRAKRKGIKDVEIYMLVQAANLTTIPDPNTTAYTHVGNMKRGLFTQAFPLAQENMAVLFTLREKNTKGAFGAYIGVFRVVIS